MIVEDVRIFEDFQTRGHIIAILGRPYPGAPRSVLCPDGKWEPIQEGATMGQWLGFRLPDGALDAIVQEHLKVAAPNTATERHLTDAIEVRDRLLAFIEKGTP